MSKSNPAKAVQETQPTDAATDPTVENVSAPDVTEKFDAPAVENELIAVKPMKALPKSHASLAKAYPSAKGFTEEGSSIALHF